MRTREAEEPSVPCGSLTKLKTVYSAAVHLIVSSRRRGGDAQMNPRGTWNVKHTGLFLQRKEYITCYPSRRLGADVVNNLVAFALCVWPETTPDPPPTPIVSLLFSLSIELILMRMTCTLQSVSM